MHVLALISVVFFALVLVIYLIRENKKDQRKLERFLNKTYKKPELSEFNDEVL